MKTLCTMAQLLLVAAIAQAATPSTMPATAPATGPAKAEAPTYVPDPNYKPTRDLSQFFAKIKAGKPVTVMAIGGSVTEGHSWAYMAAQWLRKEFPGKDIRYVDGACGGTGPVFCMFRLRRDHLSHKPDLVFVEYSVNAYPPKEDNWRALDSILQQFLMQPQKPDFVFVYVGNQKHERALDVVQPVGRYYGFPEVDPRAHLQTYIDAGKLEWKDIARDGIHPDRRGHEIYAEPVIELLKQQSALADKPTPVPPVPQPFYSADWITATILPIAAAKIEGPWKVVKPPLYTGRFVDEVLQCDQLGATLTVTANTTTFGVMGLMTGNSGKLSWSIDGGPERETNFCNSYVLKGGVWVRNVLFARDLPPGQHTLKVTIAPKWDQSNGNMIHIAGFCVTNPMPESEPAPPPSK